MQGLAKNDVTETVNSNNSGRIWLWGFLAVIALSQLYVVRELLVVFLLFALGFAAIAFVVASLYMLLKAWEMAVERLAVLRHPVMSMATVSDIASVARENRKAA
ncbi:MAG TPA: hypothetical protein VJW94_11775 [Candidatus Acidoferrum sp.]|nr:hypothetical protein [Candidatus Acidoferrum sp.]